MNELGLHVFRKVYPNLDGFFILAFIGLVNHFCLFYVGLGPFALSV